MIAAILVVGAVSLSVGTMSIGLADVWAVLTGVGDRRTMVLLEWRLPRLLFAVTCGLALGVSGALFQSLTRNPLGSPDIIGFSAGSYTGAVVVMLLIGSTSYATVAAGTPIGGTVTALGVYGLAYRRGLHSFRLIIVGIGLSAMLHSFNSLLLLRVSAEQAMAAAVWGAGSLADLGFKQLGPYLLAATVGLLAAGLVSPAMRQVELGDDAARALGIRVDLIRLLAVLIGVALIAAVTAAVGPIGFIALAAPQISRRITGGDLLDPVPVALTGALLLAGADLIALLVDMPTGIITVTVGGSYLVWLLIAEYRGTKGSR